MTEDLSKPKETVAVVEPTTPETLSGPAPESLVQSEKSTVVEVSIPKPKVEGKQTRGEYLEKFKKEHPAKRRDIFESYDEVNSFELDLPNTQNKLVLSLHKNKRDSEEHLLKWRIGKSSMFIDAKTAFVVSEAMRHLTEDIVPDELKPIADMKNVEQSST